MSWQIVLCEAFWSESWWFTQSKLCSAWAHNKCVEMVYLAREPEKSLVVSHQDFLIYHKSMVAVSYSRRLMTEFNKSSLLSVWGFMFFKCVLAYLIKPIEEPYRALKVTGPISLYLPVTWRVFFVEKMAAREGQNERSQAQGNAAWKGCSVHVGRTLL